LAKHYIGQSVPLVSGPEELSSLFLKWVLFFWLSVLLLGSLPIYTVWQSLSFWERWKGVVEWGKNPSGEGGPSFP